MGLLADAFGEGSILIKESVDTRSEAIEIAGELLVQSGKAKHSYVASMLEAVERFGPLCSPKTSWTGSFCEW